MARKTTGRVVILRRSSPWTLRAGAALALVGTIILVRLLSGTAPREIKVFVEDYSI